MNKFRHSSFFVYVKSSPLPYKFRNGNIKNSVRISMIPPPRLDTDWVNVSYFAFFPLKVSSNKLAIDQLQTSPTASSGLASRINTIENRLNNLQPTGQVQTQLLTLGHRIDLMQATVSTLVYICNGFFRYVF